MFIIALNVINRLKCVLQIGIHRCIDCTINLTNIPYKVSIYLILHHKYYDLFLYLLNLNVNTKYVYNKIVQVHNVW